MTEPRKALSKLQQASVPIRELLFSTTEGKILAGGIALSVISLFIMGVTALLSPGTARMMGAMAFSNIVFGRAVSITIGYAGGYGHTLVITVNMIVETILVLLFYPLFVFSLNKLVVFPALKNTLDRVHQAATHHQDKIRRYGLIGLFGFVWFPFWMTGPVIGCAIGHLIQLPVWLNLSIVLTGTYIAMGAWAFVLFNLQQRAEAIGPWAPGLIVVIIIAIVAAGYLLNKKRSKGGEPDKE